jgi:hypothetical protein
VEPVIFTPRRLVLRKCWCFTAGSLLKGSKPIGSCTSTASSTITIVKDGVIPGTTRFVAANQLSKQQTHNRLEERRKRRFQDESFGLQNRLVRKQHRLIRKHRTTLGRQHQWHQIKKTLFEPNMQNRRTPSIIDKPPSYGSEEGHVSPVYFLQFGKA